jgi:hypothetical protein
MSEYGSDDKPKRSLKRLKEKVEQSVSMDGLDKAAERILDEEKIADSKSNRTLREGYANRIYWYLTFYSAGAFILILLHGFKVLGFSLDTSVLNLVVGSTAVSAIGLVGIVARSLFKSKD